MNHSQWGESRENILEARSMTFPVINVPYSVKINSNFVKSSYKEYKDSISKLPF